MNGAALGYWLMVLGAAVVTVGTLGLIYWRLREGYRETMLRVWVEQVTQCQGPSSWDFDEVDRRMQAGEKQSWCATCQRWKWADERCVYFVDEQVAGSR